MNLGSILVGFVMIALVAAGVVFIAANQSSVVTTDTFGNTYNAQANLTNDVINTTTNTGAAATGGIVIVLACLGIGAAVMMLYVYSKK